MTPGRLDADVVVVGGGPAGAATAWSLARNGVDVLVVDRARFPRPKPCAEYLSPQAARVLDEMGVLATLERGPGARLAGMRVVALDGVSFEGRFHADHGFRGHRDHGLAVRRERLDAVLLDAARQAGARVVEDCAVEDVVRSQSAVAGVAGRLGGEPTTIRARHVVGADGLRSVVARRLGVARRFGWPKRYAFVSHFEGVAEVGDCGEMHVFDDGYCGLAPVGGDVVNVAVVTTPSVAAGAAGDADRFIRLWIGRHASLERRFAGARPVSRAIATGPFAARARTAWADGASLVGDAADFFDPFTGEGIYAALRGGELLAPYVVEALRARDARHARHALAAYDRCRRHEFGPKWRLERLVALAVAHPPLLAALARRLRARRDLADLLVGVTGDFVPAREVLNARFTARLLFAGTAPPPAPRPRPA